MNFYKTHNCGELNKSNVGKKVKLCGWVDSIRNLGGIIFVNIRDQFGKTQILIPDNEKLINIINNINTETTITVEGLVKERNADANLNMKTGEIEIIAENIVILSKRSKDLPFEVNAKNEVREDLRLQYRFLDLRGEKLHESIIFRSKVIKKLRMKMEELDFIEIQTPILTASSPEGARDYLVPSRIHEGEFYALPQAPQQYKQLLMMSGFDKYYQIAPCFRDEDPRADRLPGEFYQLDFEMNFATQEDVFNVLEKVIGETFVELSDFECDKPPFIRIPYKEAMIKYGSDKPDLRNPLIIKDVTEIFKNTEFNAFKEKTIKIINVENGAQNTRKFFDNMQEFAIKELEAKGLAWVKIDENFELTGSIAKFIDEDTKIKLFEITESKANDCIFFIADDYKKTIKQAGNIRIELGKRLNLINENIFKFCLITEFPMYESDDEGNIGFGHNPFSMPIGGMKSLETLHPIDIAAYQYDLVCNGYEIASGAVRNHDPEVMIKAFQIAGYDKSVIEEKFPALFNAFHYGASPHAGAAPGIDRIIMLLRNETNIREIVPFPKNQKARDLLIGAPSKVTKEQLNEIHLKLDIKEK